MSVENISVTHTQLVNGFFCRLRNSIAVNHPMHIKNLTHYNAIIFV